MIIWQLSAGICGYDDLLGCRLLWFHNVCFAERRKVTSEDAPAVSSPAIDPSDLKQPKNVSQPDSSAANVSNPPPGKSASKKKSKAGKMGRSAPAPPTDAELSAVFSMLNPKGMSAIIGSDIKQVPAQECVITIIHHGLGKIPAVGMAFALCYRAVSWSIHVYKHLLHAFAKTIWPCHCYDPHHVNLTI